MTDKFQHDYLVIDEFGKKELLCMASGKVVASRIERISEKFRGRTVMEFMHHSDYRELPFLLKDNSVAFLIFCDEFKDVEIGEEDLKRINDQLRRARIIELKSHGKTNDVIEAMMTNFSKKEVVRRLSASELREMIPNYDPL